jgi:hypothetical protein
LNLVPSRLQPEVEVEGPPSGLLLVLLYRSTPLGEVADQLSRELRMPLQVEG